MPGDENSYRGKQIGNYRIVAELGSGGFADVYQGQHLIFAHDPPVAIKLLYARLKTKEREQFIQEAQLLRKLHHPHILTVLDAGFHESIPYIVMEYALQGSLQDRLDQQPEGPLPIDEALTILTQIGEALLYAHQQNIVHRDLKPDNILFNAKGEALLADFGLATILSSSHTILVGSAGTPAYMAPEMFTGIVSVKSDQYALGCIAYELITGHKLLEVEGVPLYAVQYQHAHVEPFAPSQRNPQVPQHIERAILTAMAKDRNHRHVDVHAFLTALQTPQKSTQEWLSEGNALYDLKHYEEALAAYEQARHLDSENVAIYRSIATLLLDLNRYESALAVLEQASQLTSQDAWIYTQKGIAMRNTRQEEAALAAHDQAIQLSPKDHWVLCEKAITLRAFKRYEEALPVHDQAIQADPNSAWVYKEKAITLRNFKRYEEALVAFDQAFQLDPTDARLLTEKAITIRDFTDYE